MEYVPNERKPRKTDPPGFRIMRSHWFDPDGFDSHKAPVYVVFTIAAGQRRAFSVTRTVSGRLCCEEYEWFQPPDEDGQTAYAAPISYPEFEDPERPVVANLIGDAIDGWVVGGHLPV